MEAGKRTTRDIFNRGRNLEIPFFQRAYVWDKQQWQRFLEDMRMVSSTNKPYFLGSVILKKQQNIPSNQDDRLTIIDGQQRLTTLNIFMKVLCLMNNENSTFEETFTKQRDKTIILLHNHNDEKSFNRVVSLNSIEELEFDSENDNILGAYNYFSKNITKADIESNLNIYNILDKLLFVGIDLVVEDEEQQIFDTINSLGVRLTTAELLKNYFFNRSETDKYEKYWKSIFETDNETRNYWDKEITTGRMKRTFIDLFFYSVLQIKIHDDSYNVKAEDKISFSRVEHLFDSYKLFIKKYKINHNEFLKEIKEYAQLFKTNFNHKIIEEELSSENGIERINAIIFGLDTTTLISYVLYILKNVSDDAARNELFGFIETFVLRRMVTRDTTKNYNQFFTDRLITNQIKTNGEFKNFLINQEDKINNLPSDLDLKRGFDSSVLTNKQAAGVIYFIESKIRDNDKQSTRLLGIRKYSLEHLMPKKWENNWSQLDGKEQKDNRNFMLKTLGNLAIITQSLNASISESEWEVKKNGRNNKNGLKHYSGGIETLAPYLDEEVWDEDQIVLRANNLYKSAIKIWPVDEQFQNVAVSIIQADRQAEPDEESLHNEVRRVRRKLRRWAENQEQYNSRILNAYLKLVREGIERITVDMLKSSANIDTFIGHFNGMKQIAERNHCKVFEMVGDQVTIWGPVEEYVRKYESKIFD